jgi:glutaredoxin
MPPPRIPARVALLAVGGVVFAAAAAIVLRSARAPVPASATQAGLPPVVSESAEPVVTAAATVQQQPVRAPPVAVSPQDEEARVAWLRAVASGVPAPSAPPAGASPTLPEPPVTDSPREPPRAAAVDWLALARQAHIVVYTAPWCSVCRRAKAFLDAKGVSYDDRDVDTSPDDARALRRLNPRASIPTFDIDGSVMVGFSESSFIALVERAAGSR